MVLLAQLREVLGQKLIDLSLKAHSEISLVWGAGLNQINHSEVSLFQDIKIGLYLTGLEGAVFVLLDNSVQLCKSLL